MSLTVFKCARCDVSYPPELLSIFHGELFDRKSVCAICALDIINAVHGTSKTALRGMAEEMRQDALQWRAEAHR